jgi:CP family cyanate transporter-like MFS transporter
LTARTATRAGLLAALFASALALRPQIVAIGPLLPDIQEDLGISHAVAGLLTTIPVLCMGLFAPPAPYLSARLGSRLAIAFSLGLIASFGILRVLTPEAAATILLTFGVGIGIGFAGALLPVATKERFADRPAFATGMYTTGINVGSAVAAALAVPIASIAFGWRLPLFVFSAVTVVLLVAWLVQTRRGESRAQRAFVRPPRLPLRSPVAWLLVSCFGFLGLTFYGLNAWLPDAYVERGWDEGAAGALLAVYNIAALPGGLVISWLGDRLGSRRLWFSGSVALMMVGMLGVNLVPDAGWLWVILMGFANGLLFALVMTLPLDVSDEPQQVGAVAGMMLGVGYCVAALAPFALGAVRDATGSYATTLWVVVGFIAALFTVSLLLTRERLHRGVGPVAAARSGGR